MTDEPEMLSALGLNKFLDPSNLVDAVVDRRNNPIRHRVAMVEATGSVRDTTTGRDPARRL